MRRMKLIIGALALVGATGCQRSAERGASIPDTVMEGEALPAASVPLAGPLWILTHLGDSVAPMGAGNRAPNIQFDSTDMRAAGFAGCNRFGAQYRVNGDSLLFSAAMSTKMYCQDGDAAERAFLMLLPTVSSYAVSDSVLTLFAAGVPAARFAASAEVPE